MLWIHIRSGAVLAGINERQPLRVEKFFQADKVLDGTRVADAYVDKVQTPVKPLVCFCAKDEHPNRSVDWWVARWMANCVWTAWSGRLQEVQGFALEMPLIIVLQLGSGRSKLSGTITFLGVWASPTLTSKPCIRLWIGRDQSADIDAEADHPSVATYIQLHFKRNLTKVNKFGGYLNKPNDSHSQLNNF